MIDDNKLPEGWTFAAIETICEAGRPISYGVLQPGTEHPDGIPLVRVCDINDGMVASEQLKRISPAISKRFPRTVLRGGEVLLTVVGTIGRTAVASSVLQGANTARAVAVLPVSPSIEPKYVELVLRDSRMRNLLTRAAHEVARKTLNLEDVRAVKIPIAPLNEQHRIVAKIEELFSDLDAGVAALKRAKANLKRYRAAVLKAAVEGKFTEEWRAKHPAKEPASALLARILKERRQKWEADQLAKFAAAKKEPPKNWREKYVEPSPPATTGLPELPDGWCWVTVDQLLCESTCNGISIKGADSPPGVAALRLNSMTPNGFDYSERRYIPISDELAFDLAVQPGDLFVSRGNGSLHLVGRCVLAHEPPAIIVFPDTMIRVRLTNIGTLREFINLTWASRLMRKQIEKKARTTAGIYKISQRDVEEFVIPFPPLDEQQQLVEEVAERLSQIESSETVIDHGLLRASRLRQSILKQAFEGKLVPQDPKDEPASVLLERLCASRSLHERNGKAATGGRRTKQKQVERMADE